MQLRAKHPARIFSAVAARRRPVRGGGRAFLSAYDRLLGDDEARIPSDSVERAGDEPALVDLAELPLGAPARCSARSRSPGRGHPARQVRVGDFGEELTDIVVEEYRRARLEAESESQAG